MNTLPRRLSRYFVPSLVLVEACDEHLVISVVNGSPSLPAGIRWFPQISLHEVSPPFRGSSCPRASGMKSSLLDVPSRPSHSPLFRRLVLTHRPPKLPFSSLHVLLRSGLLIPAVPGVALIARRTLFRVALGLEFGRGRLNGFGDAPALVTCPKTRLLLLAFRTPFSSFFPLLRPYAPRLDFPNLYGSPVMSSWIKGVSWRSDR